MSMRTSVIIAFQCAFVAVAGGQTAPPGDTLAEARRLTDASDFAGAAALMRRYAESHPDDVGSARFAALMAYWAKDRTTADSLYARSFSDHPGDANLRLEYGRFLIETGATRRARTVLEPMVGDSSAFQTGEIARARTLIGTAEYWQGDFTSARREFVSALELDSSVTDARRQLREIELAAASWVRVGADLWDDDQPLGFAAADADGAWFVNPLTPLGVRARSTVFDRDGISESVLSAEASLATYVPAARLELSVGAGVLERSFDASTDWTGRAALGFRLPRTLSLQARYARSPYTSTIRSLTRAIMVQTVEGGARWGTPRRWMGEAVGRRETYPDDNHVSTGFGWVLAPLVSRDGGTLHAGYGFTASSADNSRFVPRGDVSVVPLPPGQGLQPVAGEYNPYYTPRNLRVHSALVRVGLRGADRWSLEANGRYAISAHDDAPMLVALASPPNTIVSRLFFRRSFTPWNARGSLDWAASPAVRVGLAVEHGREAFYSFTSARAQLTYTFVSAAERRADIR
jgi:hypothetical protein